MNPSPTEADALRTLLRDMAMEAGACAVGFAKAAPVEPADRQMYQRWIEERSHAGLQYMERNAALRFDPRLLIAQMEGRGEEPVEGTVISMAFNYNPPTLRSAALPAIARFAYGEDYHQALRRRLKPIAQHIVQATGCKARICIDSAPVRERYWAVKSGIAMRGRNGLAIVPGIGSYVFLAEILTSLCIGEERQQEPRWCLSCGKCHASCPGAALRADATLDCSRCVSYATIEMPSAPSPEGFLFGCDRCQTICPHNVRAPKTLLPEFHPSEKILNLSHFDIHSLSEEDFAREYAKSPLRRAGLEGLKLNLTPESEKNQG